MSGARGRMGRGKRDKRPPVDVGVPPERRVGALAVAFRRAIRTPIVVANTAGAIVGFAIIVVAGQPSLAVPLLLRGPAAVASFAVVACLLLPFLVRGPVRAALESFAWIGRWDAIRWTKATGVKPFSTPEQARAWLEANPLTGGADALTRLAHIEPLLLTGDVAGARTIAVGLPTGSAWDRFEALYQRAFVDFTGGSRVDRRSIYAAAKELRDPEERLRGAALVAVGEARLALAERRDWLTPLVEVRPVIGEVGDGVLRLEVWPTLFRLEIILAVIIGAVGALIITLG